MDNDSDGGSELFMTVKDGDDDSSLAMSGRVTKPQPSLAAPALEEGSGPPQKAAQSEEDRKTTTDFAVGIHRYFILNQRGWLCGPGL